MSWRKFETTVPAKFVLAGEHSVLRGRPAIALPTDEFELKLKFEPSTQPGLLLESRELDPIVQDLFARARMHLSSQGRAFVGPAGTLKIDSQIPQGAGLGSSAALSVALTRWILPELGVISDEDARNFAIKLEDRFHGKSSGMDVSVIWYGKPIEFQMATGAQLLEFRSSFRFTFHDTGLKKKTKDSIQKVLRLHLEETERANLLDDQMQQAVELCRRGLQENRLSELAAGMSLAHECFEEWGLVPLAAMELRDQLLGEGAQAVKLTGAGGGGYLVAVWAE